MSLRRTASKVAAVAAIACSATLALVPLAGPAGANGEQYPSSVLGQAPFTAGKPFSSGQTVTVSIPANSTLSPVSASAMVVVECAAPNGVLPTQDSQCDPNTNYPGSVYPSATGAVSITNYQVYSLPNAGLGEPSTNTPVCGNTAATECVLLVGTSYTNFAAAPHVFTQPFLINVDPTNSGTNPGDGTPEAPLAIGLPIAAAGAIGGVLFFRRRRSARSDAA